MGTTIPCEVVPTLLGWDAHICVLGENLGKFFLEYAFKIFDKMKKKLLMRKNELFVKAY